MGISDVLMMLGGLSLFLYGMKMMSDGLETMAGNKLQSILEKLTTNRFKAVAVGAIITAIIQSSSATTVMVVGFVNAGLMNLTQAVGLIMGANIGTTITGQLIALDVSAIAPLIAIVGVVLVTFFKNKKLNSFGGIMAGLGILFIGMDMMGDAMVPLRNSTLFIQLMTTFSNPLIGILAGTIFTGIIQSSSASVGILQTLAMNGLIGLSSSCYVLFGMNIGTCVTAVLSSLGSNRNAKRVAIMHLAFNAIGTVIFVVICFFTPLTDYFVSLTPTNPAAQLANLHTFFNIVTTIVMLPFANSLVQISQFVLKDKSNEKETAIHVPDMRIGSVAIAMYDVRNELNIMFKLCKESIDSIFTSLIETKEANAIIEDNEVIIDKIHHEIIKAVPQITSLKMTEEDALKLSKLFSLNSDIERIGDHIVNLQEHLNALFLANAKFSVEATNELKKIQRVIMGSVNAIKDIEVYEDNNVYQIISQNEYLIDDLCETFRNNQFERIKDHVCGLEASMIYNEILVDVERIGDHLFNIGSVLYRK